MNDLHGCKKRMSLSQYSVARDKTSDGAAVKSHALHMVGWASGVSTGPMERAVRSHRFEEEVPVARSTRSRSSLISLVIQRRRVSAAWDRRDRTFHMECLVGTPY